ncbi:ganglioside-induced differentiation-associated protein 1 [Octopus sinensis]|uniref:Ganglioside-induced differentiation-associated protein 1 n=1 Tax=Octopus sinensis TaxID=2607531 RepID=A0A6P7SBV3_9MOLL|nr:ganglioside-induced differentiation-associated protein 1 [Octopus sinensis]
MSRPSSRPGSTPSSRRASISPCKVTAASMKNRFMLYFHPLSFYSQKVVLALYEKEIPFKRHYVNLLAGQQNEPWFLEINPKGKIPALKDGDKVIVESDNIIDYLESTVQSVVTLVPDESFEVGQEVSRIRKLLNCVKVEIISYGIIMHEELSITGCKLPFYVQKTMKENYGARLGTMLKLAEKNPSFRDTYLSKSQQTAQRFEQIMDIEQVMQELEDLEDILDEMETLIMSSSEGSSDYDQELWLFGSRFTAADISLIVLLNRLVMLGIDSRYFSEDRRPYLLKYHKQQLERASVGRLLKEIETIRKTMYWQSILKSSSFSRWATIGLGIGLGYLIYRHIN